MSEMDDLDPRWQDAMKGLSARHAPTSAQTERFVAAVMARLEPRPSPWLEAARSLLQPRWLVPALGVGLASVFLAIGRQADTLDMEVLVGAASAPSELVLPAEPARPLMAPEAP